VFPYREETSVTLPATAEAAFAWLDDFHHLSAHIETDQAGGRQVGSRVHVVDRVLGKRLALDEAVILREPPLRKAWRTLSANLLVIGRYELGFELEPDGHACRLRVRIDYDLPRRGAGRWLGRLFGASYARWCTARMARDAARHFAPARLGA
jgi:hypothetical protein